MGEADSFKTRSIEPPPTGWLISHEQWFPKPGFRVLELVDQDGRSGVLDRFMELVCYICHHARLVEHSTESWWHHTGFNHWSLHCTSPGGESIEFRCSELSANVLIRFVRWNDAESHPAYDFIVNTLPKDDW